MGPCENNAPFGGYFAPPFAGMGRPPFGCPFRGGDFPDHHWSKPSFGPFGWQRFDRSPERHCRREPDHPRWGPFAQGHKGCASRGASECNCCGPHSRGCRHERRCHGPATNRPHPWFGRKADQHCCGRRDQSRCCDCSCQRRCEGSNCCRHTPCCDQRKQCHDHHCVGRSRNAHCDNCCRFDPCCGGNKEDCICDDNLDETDDEPASERDNKIRMVVLWLLRELFWKAIKGRPITDSNHMDIIITSTPALQGSLGVDSEEN